MDEVHSADDRGIVVAIPVRLTVRGRQESLLLIEPDGVTVDAEGIGNFSNEHDPRIVLDLEVHFKVYRESMNITLQYFEGCPNWKVADQRLTALAKENPGIVVTRHIVDTVEEAERVSFRGSPTVEQLIAELHVA